MKYHDNIMAIYNMYYIGIAYKQFGPNYKSLAKIPKSMVREYPPIDIIPVTSACTFDDKMVRCGDEISLCGYAYSGGGRAIVRVDVSIDNGKTWDQAKLIRANNNQGIRSNKAWAWTQWRYPLKINNDLNELNICCKAIDDQYNQQPHTVAPIWNVRGILNTSWGRVNVKTDKWKSRARL